MAFEYNITRVFREEREQARVEDRADALILLLEEMGDIPENLRQKITSEKDFDTLSKWLKAAAHAENMDDFIAEIE